MNGVTSQDGKTVYSLTEMSIPQMTELYNSFVATPVSKFRDVTTARLRLGQTLVTVGAEVLDKDVYALADEKLTTRVADVATEADEAVEQGGDGSEPGNPVTAPAGQVHIPATTSEGTGETPAVAGKTRSTGTGAGPIVGDDAANPTKPTDTDTGTVRDYVPEGVDPEAIVELGDLPKTTRAGSNAAADLAVFQENVGKPVREVAAKLKTRWGAVRYWIKRGVITLKSAD